MNFFNCAAIHNIILICKILFSLYFIKTIINRSSINILNWLLIIFIIPYLALPLYLLFVTYKHKYDFYKKQNNYIKIKSLKNLAAESIINVLVNHNIDKPTSNNKFFLYKNGTQAYLSLLKKIREAKYSIYISTYVFKNDSVTKKIIEELKIKAEQKVDVKILLDALGSYKVYINQKIFQKLRNAGGNVSFFISIKNYINFRNHRKIYLFDKKILFTGGMNIGNEYMGPNICNNRWEDLLFKIEGYTVKNFYQIFIKDWELTTKELLPKFIYFKNKYYGKNNMQVAPSGPDINAHILYESLIAGIHSSQNKIWLVTPYFIPPASMFEALKIAYYRGVDVKLIIPEESNHFIADLARYHYIKKLQNIGIKIYLFDKKMIHAKAVLFDKSAVMLGTVNLDNRSFFINYEIAIYIYEKKIIEQIEFWMKKIINISHNKLKKQNKTDNFLSKIVKILDPLL